jgi:hypothetical protein
MDGIIMKKQSNDDLYKDALARKMARALLIVQVERCSWG